MHAQTPQSYTVEGMSKYSAFGEATFSHYADAYTKIAASYTDNREYIEGATDAVKTGAKSYFKDLLAFECAILDFTCAMERTKDHILDLAAAGVTGLGLIKDFVFGEKEKHALPSTYEDYFNYTYPSMVQPKQGFEIQVKGSFNPVVITSDGTLQMTYGVINDISGNATPMYCTHGNAGCGSLLSSPKVVSFNLANATKSNIISYYIQTGVSITFRAATTSQPIEAPTTPSPNFTQINNYIQNNPLPVVQPPNYYPLLKCSNDDVSLELKNNDFYLDDQLIQIPFNGLYNRNNEECQLHFTTDPIVINDKNEVVIVLPDNTTKSIILGDTNEPTLPVTPIDTSLLQYIRNSYDYAVNAVQTGVHGLQTVTSGFLGITTLVGSVFAFMPTEVVVFITGAFLVTIGLWVVKR